MRDSSRSTNNCRAPEQATNQFGIPVALVLTVSLLIGTGWLSSSLYNPLIIGVDCVSMHVVSETASRTVYTLFNGFISLLACAVPFVFNLGDVLALSPALLGMAAAIDEDVAEKIDILITYARVSSASQEDGTGIGRQEEVLQPLIDQVSPENHIEIGYEWESASTMFRASIDEILDIATNTDPDKDILLAVPDMTRLSRARTLETMAMIWVLRENGVRLWIGDYGLVDYSESVDNILLALKSVESRSGYERRSRKAAAGRRRSKENGEYPNGAPFGYEKEEDGSLAIDEDEARVYNRAVELLLNGYSSDDDDERDFDAGNVKAAFEQLEIEFEWGDDDD